MIFDQSKLVFIADIGANHDGDLERAFKLIELAADAGADIVKFQHFQADKIVSKKGFEKLSASLQNTTHQSGWKKSVHEVYKDASINTSWTEQLFNKCVDCKVQFMTTPYDYEMIEHINRFVEAIKIGSGDITWIQFLLEISCLQKPVLLATGASSMEDVERAMDCIAPYAPQVVLMQCNTNYTGSEDIFNYMNLNVLNAYRNKYPDSVLGLSDHTPGFTAVLGAIALGARVIEKHFTDDNYRAGPDHGFALQPNEWREMVDASNLLLRALGSTTKEIQDNELESRIVQQRSIRLTRDIKANEKIDVYNDIEFLRPCPDDAIRPYEAKAINNMIITSDMKRGDYLSWNTLK